MEQLPGQPTGSGPGEQERNWAMLMHLATLAVLLTGGWLLNVLVPLVGMLWKGEHSAFVREHSREQLNFQITLILYATAYVVVGLLTIGIGWLLLLPLAVVVGLFAIIVIVLAALAASRGEHYRLPLNIRLIR